ncbi:MAG: alpha-galactosidase [Lachnospiraceae bacterium]|nr:alpha-galactosidase [Lachnospiraceae bacterium]
MIRYYDGCFLLNTKTTSYCFRVLPTGHLEQVYYGNKIMDDGVSDFILKASFEAMSEKREFTAGNSIAYSDDYQSICLEDTALEISTPGKGDVRENSLVIINADGVSTSDVIFKGYDITEDEHRLSELPHSSSNGKSAQTLRIEMSDEYSNALITLFYTVYPECDVITRSISVCNTGNRDIHIEKIMSLCLDLYGGGYEYTCFGGHWAREMHKDTGKLKSGSHIIASRTGTSSSRSNPLFLISDNADEDFGSVYGFNLIYSGDHYESMSVSSFGKTRFMTGINPENFSWRLSNDMCFEAPEAVMTYSDKGFGGVSLNFHSFVKDHILPVRFKDKERPILINSWEANYFRFNEDSLLRLARSAKACGIELFVMDDGWFGKRDDDHSSLGDWTVYEDKLPGGLKSLSDKIHDLGMTFGIWVEPEMINEDSRLFRAHPDYAVKVPGHVHSKGRDQLILDLTRKEVQDNVIAQMKAVFSSCRIEYVKWDMNRVFSDRFSTGLQALEQGEFSHRYILGLYRIIRELTLAFPDILFEGCASGGNRFDLGMLAFFPQIWGSDDTDAIERTAIQEGYSYGYPMITVGSHVSAVPNHQTMRCETAETRFAVACTGAFGYELDLDQLSDEELSEVYSQTEFYKKYRNTLQNGTYHRINEEQWMVVSEDKKTAVGFFVKMRLTPNKSLDVFKTKGLEPSLLYKVTNRVCDKHLSDFGSLINSMDQSAMEDSAVDLKPGEQSFVRDPAVDLKPGEQSLLRDPAVDHRPAGQDLSADGTINEAGRIRGEKMEIKALGSALNNCGVRLMYGYGGTGYNENTRIMKDMEARIYIFEAV